MLIIFEGPDLCGKTTIAKKLANDYNYKYFDFFNLKEKFKENWMKNIDFCAEIEYNCLKQFQFTNTIILDRFHISSIIYTKIFKRNYDLSYIKFNELKNIFLVYVTVNKKVLEERIDLRIEDQQIKNRIFELHQAYEQFFNSYLEPYLKLDGDDILEDNIRRISRMLF